MTRRRQIAKQIQNKNRNENRNRNRNRDNGGFTLVEVIISMSILSLVSIPLLNYFSESMRYSVKMAQQQKATIAAQALMEEMKAEEKLIEKLSRPDGTSEYGAECLENKGYVFKTTDRIDPNDEMGKITKVIYERKAGTTPASGTPPQEDAYDVEVTIQSELNEDKISDPSISGIDYAQDVVTVESRQQDEAVFYFQKFASKYNGGIFPSERDVLDLLKREICVEIGKNTADDEYTVQIYYRYSYPYEETAGVLKEKSIDSAYLLDTKIGELKNIYILYKWMDTGDKVSVTTVDPDAQAALMADPPALHMVYQKRETPSGAVPVVPDISYRLCVDSGSFNNEDMKVHTNVPIGQVYDKTGAQYPISALGGLTEEGKPVRQLTITAEVYKADHEEGDSPLAQIETTKGE